MVLVDPVNIPCPEKHVVCRVCIETQLQLSRPSCPVCGEKLKDSFKPAVKKQKE